MRFILKDATAAEHADLDRALSRLDLARRDHYAMFLHIIARGLIPLEAMLERDGVADLLPDWPVRARSAALTADLATLGVAAPDGRPDATRCSPAFAFGVLYTLEGSRLGGKLLLKQVKSAPTPLPTAYLGHGDATLWRTYCEALERSREAHADAEQSIAGARHAFAAFLHATRDILP